MINRYSDIVVYMLIRATVTCTHWNDNCLVSNSKRNKYIHINESFVHVNCIGTVIRKYSDIVVYIRTCNYKTSTCNNCTNQFSYKAGQQISSVLSVFSVLIFPPTGVNHNIPRENNI